MIIPEHYCTKVFTNQSTCLYKCFIYINIGTKQSINKLTFPFLNISILGNKPLVQSRPWNVRSSDALHQLQNKYINPLTPNDHYSGRTAPLTSKRCILYIYSTNIGTEYFKRGIYAPFFSLQNAVCFLILTYLVPVLFTYYIFIQQI